MVSSSKMAYHKYEPAWLILEDGTVYEGRSLGSGGTAVGEVVFTTGMTGYQETLTDPSYFGQIVAQTFPLIGNYGVNDTDRESGRVWLKGYIIREWCYEPSNFRSKSTLGEYLEQHNVVGIYDIDTRALTRKIREHGVMNGAVTTEYPDDTGAFLKSLKGFVISDAVRSVSDKKPSFHKAEVSKYHVALMDYGYKNNILRSLNELGCDVTVMPWDSDKAAIEKVDPDGIMLSNGPGDPNENKKIINNLKEILKTDLPVLGICLGHQIMALAFGCSTQKLKYGHRGANQPVMDSEKRRIFVTSQNHGFAVIKESVTEDIGKISHYNVNDGSCEGIKYKRPGTFTVQFHPEACAGPHDTRYLFDRFIESMEKKNAVE